MTIQGKSFRPNVAVIVTDDSGRVLLCERRKPAGAIQTVQGGIDPGETPEQAARRELQEELGLSPQDFEITEMLLKSYRYIWDPPIRKQLEEKHYVGQEQHFFLAKVRPDVKFDLDKHHREFQKVYWGTPENMLKHIWETKRPGMKAAIEAFKRKS